MFFNQEASNILVSKNTGRYHPGMKFVLIVNSQVMHPGTYWIKNSLKFSYIYNLGEHSRGLSFDDV